MSNVTKPKILPASINAIKNRPNGLDVAQYKNINEWSYHQWAWEYLRRNEKFIKACEEVKSGNRSKQAVARKFGLKKYKYYGNAYEKKSPAPEFLITSPFVWSNLTISNNKSKKKEINLWPGQLIIRLDLAAAIDHEGALEKQQIEALSKIETRISDFKSRYGDLIKQHKPQDHTLGIYIRLLDLKASGTSNLQCGKLILKNKVQDGASNDDLREDIKQRLKSARELAGKNYKYLSVKDGFPPEGTVIPIEL